jgi:hypothetical protein
VPKGKYPRQSAAVKAAISKVAPVIAPAAAQTAQQAEVVEVVEVVAPAAPAVIDPALLSDAAEIVTQAAQVAEVVISNARRPHRFADHAKSRDLNSLTHDQLRAYGLEIGMSKRDCADLSEDRLRAGCRAHLMRHFDELTE